MDDSKFINRLFIALIAAGLLCFYLFCQLLSAKHDLKKYKEEIPEIAHWRYMELLGEYENLYNRCEEFLDSTGEARGYYELYFELSTETPTEEYGDLLDEAIDEWISSYEAQKEAEREYERNH